ncbi:MAG: hypothetical protein LLG14_11195 [Nocardiaceae bacterium]|nr:hypothetical protein [Nocardiaceae bacterium]
MTQYMCPVCGYDNLSEPAYDAEGLGNYVICPSCGYEFGVTDDDEGITTEEWRIRWIESGMKWWSKRAKPANWDPVAQLAHVQPKP